MLRLFLDQQLDCLCHMIRVVEWSVRDIQILLFTNKKINELTYKYLTHIGPSTKLIAISDLERFPALKYVNTKMVFNRTIYTNSERTKPHKLKYVNIVCGSKLKTNIVENIDLDEYSKITLTAGDVTYVLIANILYISSSNNNVDDLDAFMKMIRVDKIQYLICWYIGNSTITQPLPNVRKLKATVSPGILNIVGNRVLLPNLVHLDTGCIQIGPLPELPSITKLTLNGSKIRSDEFDFSKFPNLKKMKLIEEGMFIPPWKIKLLKYHEIEIVAKRKITIELPYSVNVEGLIEYRKTWSRRQVDSRGLYQLIDTILIMKDGLQRNAKIKCQISLLDAMGCRNTVNLVLTRSTGLNPLFKWFTIALMAICEDGVKSLDDKIQKVIDLIENK